MPMRERDIEKKVCDFAKSQGWLAFKFASPNHRGVPDRIFFKNGQVLLIEFKAPGKKPKALQVKTINELRNSGIECHAIDSIESGKRVFEQS